MKTRKRDGASGPDTASQSSGGDLMQNFVQMPVTFGSLFSGIGGLDLGFERAGFKCVWQVEINEFARAVLAKHWPGVPKHDDIRTFTPTQADIVCGGFPCQDISHVGHRAGIDGERSGLWSEFLRVIREVRPRFVVVENVTALLVRGMDRVCGDLAASGYDAEWDCIPASAFGAPHQRDRIFICAYPAGSRPQRCLQSKPINREAGEGWNGEPTRVLSRDWYYGSNVHRHTGMDDGVPDRVERVRGYGNAVVPQVAEWLGRQIASVF